MRLPSELSTKFSSCDYLEVSLETREKSYGVEGADDSLLNADTGDLEEGDTSRGKDERLHEVEGTGDLEGEDMHDKTRDVEGKGSSTPSASLETEDNGFLERKRGFRFSRRAFSITFLLLEEPEILGLRHAAFCTGDKENTLAILIVASFIFILVRSLQSAIRIRQQRPTL